MFESELLYYTMLLMNYYNIKKEPTNMEDNYENIYFIDTGFIEIRLPSIVHSTKMIILVVKYALQFHCVNRNTTN